MNWHQMWSLFWTQEGNMWLYSTILYFWLKLGTSPLVLRSLSALFAAATVPVFYLLANKIKGQKAAMLATPLFITNMYFIFFAQLGRGYSLTLLLVTISSLFFYQFITDVTLPVKYLALYVLFSILSIYSYLLTGLILVAQYLALFLLPVKIPWKKMTIAAICVWAGIIPLILSPAFRSGSQLDWLQRPPFVHIVFAGIVLSGDSIIATLLCFIVLLLFVIKKRDTFSRKTWERFTLSYLILWGAFPILFGFIFSLFFRPIFRPESFNTSLPAFLILLVIAIETLPIKKWVAYGAILFFFVFRLFAWYTGNPSQQIVFENKAPRDWNSITRYIVANGSAKDAVVFYAYYIREPFIYYVQQEHLKSYPKPIEIASGSYVLSGGSLTPEPSIETLETLPKKYRRVWLVLSYNDFTYLDLKDQWKDVETELGEYYKIVQVINYNQASVKLLVEKHTFSPQDPAVDKAN